MSAYPILFCSERMFTKSFPAICFFSHSPAGRNRNKTKRKTGSLSSGNVVEWVKRLPLMKIDFSTKKMYTLSSIEMYYFKLERLK